MAVAQPHYHNHALGYRQYDKVLAGTMSPELTSPANGGVHEKSSAPAAAPNANPSESPQLSPVFKSEAAKQIIKEMTEKRVEGPRRRQIPREKRRHYTVSSSKPVLDLEDTFSKMVLFVSFNFRSLCHAFPFFCFFSFIVCVSPLLLTSNSSLRHVPLYARYARDSFENSGLAHVRDGNL